MGQCGHKLADDIRVNVLREPQDVSGFEVTVDDLQLVEVVHALADVEHAPDSHAPAETVFLPEQGEADVRRVLHDAVGLCSDHIPAVDRDDVLVFVGCGDFHLLADLCAVAFFEDLDGDWGALVHDLVHSPKGTFDDEIFPSERKLFVPEPDD